MPDISKIQAPNGLTLDIKDAVSRQRAEIYYCIGSENDKLGEWTGTISGLGDTIYDGTTIIYVPLVSGGSTKTTLNINNKGACDCKYGSYTNLTTQYDSKTPILFTYRLGYWYCAGVEHDYSTHIYYVKGPANPTDTTVGVWTGTIVDPAFSKISSYYDGLTVLYVPNVAGANTTTLNINNLGPADCYYTSTIKLTMQYPAETPILLTCTWLPDYTGGQGQWRWRCVGVEDDNETHIYYVEGPDTDTTAGSWTGTITAHSFAGRSGYYDGLTVLYVPHVAGASTTYLNINNFGNAVCYYTNTTKLTTHYSVGTPILLTYTNGYWRRADYDSNTTSISNLQYANGKWIADKVIYRYQLLFEVDENTLTPLNTVNNGSSNTNKAMLTNAEFNPFGHIFIYNTTKPNVAEDGEIEAGYLMYSFGTVDSRYTFNHGSTLTANRPLYLKVTMLSNGKCKIANSLPLTQTLPSTNDGYCYIFLGRTYSTYQFSLYPNHPVYYHDGTSIRLKQNTMFGNVVGPHISVDNNIATFNGTDGSSVKDSTYSITTSVNRYGECISSGSSDEKDVLLTRGSISNALGTRITVNFVHCNTSATPYMTVTDSYGNSVGAYIGRDNGSLPYGQPSLLCGNTDFVFDGTTWNILGKPLSYFDITLTDMQISAPITNYTYQKPFTGLATAEVLFAIIFRAWPKENWDHGAIVSIAQLSQDTDNVYFALTATSYQRYDMTIRCFYNAAYLDF